MSEFSKNLFDRVPAPLFRPLGSSVRARKNWAMLEHLYSEFFSPHAVPPEGEGFTQRTICESLEMFLFEWGEANGPDEPDDADQSDDATLDLGERATSAFNRLEKAGWLRRERIGFMKYVFMPPTVQGLFERLQQFADQGPEFIGGRVRAVHNNLKLVRSDPTTNAEVFQLAATECSNLLRMLNTTRMRVREARDLLREEKKTAEFLSHYFSDYIQRLYIGDFTTLFSNNHPLASRWQIIELTLEMLDDPPARRALRAWYRANLRHASDEAADAAIEEDASRIYALQSVEPLLRRLKIEVSRVNDQVLGYLNYQLRSQGDVESWVKQAARAIVLSEASAPEKELTIPLGWSCGRLFSEEDLKGPLPAQRKRKGARIQKRELSVEAQVRRLIRQIIFNNRKVSDKVVLAYIDKHLPESGVLESAQMPIETINELCVVASFTRLGIIADRQARNAARGIRRPHALKPLHAHLEIELTGERFSNKYMDAPAVRIRRRPTRGQSRAV